MTFIIVATWISVVKLLLPLIPITTFYGLFSFLFWTFFVIAMSFYLSILSLFTGQGTTSHKGFNTLSGEINKHLSDVHKKRR